MKKITAVIVAGSVCVLAIAARAVTSSTVKNHAQYIGEAKAREIALEKAGLSQSDVTFKKTKLDRDDGVYVYEVEFRSADAKFEADVNAKDGTVIKFEQEGKVKGNKKAADNSELITEEAAKSTALNKAGISEAEANFTKTKLDRDDGLYVYEFEFTAGDTKYDVDVNAVTGEIVKFETKVKKDKQEKKDKTEQTQTEPSYIGEDKALESALEKAGLTETEITVKKSKLAKDDGRYVYEFEFTSDNTEYDIDVNAVTGEILKFETEEKKVKAGKTEQSAATDTAYIGEDKALELVLERAGLTKEDISQTKVKLDRDDGIYVYEVEFRNGRTEYDAEVNATDGEILSFEKDIDD